MGRDHGHPSPRGRSLRDADGYTVVEALVAALLLVIGGLAALQLFDAGTRNAYRAEESQVVNNRLQAELEAIKRLPYAQVALTEQPAKVGDQNDPRWRIAQTKFALARDGGDPRELVFNGGAIPGGGVVSGGTVDPGPTPFRAGDVSGRIYRFVVWADDPGCAECYGATKRVVVAAAIDEAPASFERTFQELQTDVVDPEATPDDNPGPDEDDPGTATAQFWLTDTPCSAPARQPITGDHAAHNTRGVCASGIKSGSTRGAPDLMYTEAPALDPNYPPEGQPLYDYASDSEPVSGADLDRGLLLQPSTTDTCLLSPVLNTLDIKRLLEGILSVLSLPALPGQLDGVLDLTAGGAGRHHQVHTWVSPPISGSGGVLLGRGTLDLYTKTVNGAVHPGEICAWLSVRQSVTIPAQLCVIVCIPLGSTTIEVDLPLINVGLLTGGECRTGLGLNLTNFRYSQNPWPRTWTKISVPMCFAAVNAAGAVIPAVLPPSSRIVLSVMVRPGGTQGNGLEFMYDAVGFESRLELETNKVLSF